MNSERILPLLKKPVNKLIHDFAAILLFIMLCVNFSLTYGQNKKPAVGFLTLKALADCSIEQQQAFNALNKVVDTSNTVITADQLSNPLSLIDKQILWYHKPDTTEFDKSLTKKKNIEAIHNYVKNGGTLLLTLDAVRLIKILGIESKVPERRVRWSVDEGYGRKSGFHAYHEHPLFDGLFGGAYIQNPKKDTSFVLNGYFGDDVPSGRVIGINWAYINFEENNKLVWEYSLGKGKILCIGAYTVFSISNFNSMQLLRFLENSLNYLNGGASSSSSKYWSYTAKTISGFNQKSDSISTPAPAFWIYKDDSLSIHNPEGNNDPWNVAGNRMVCMGKEKGGIEEVWAHPFMAIRDYEVGLLFEGSTEPLWLSKEKPQITVRPECFMRDYLLRNCSLKETIITGNNKAVTIIRYEYIGKQTASIIIKYNTSLRQMWPYSEKTGGNIQYTWDSGLKAHVIIDSSEKNMVILGADREPTEQICGRFEDIKFIEGSLKAVATEKFQVSSMLKYQLKLEDDLTVVLSASNDGYDRTKLAYVRTQKEPVRLYLSTKKYWNEIISKSLTISSPDPDFNRGYCWALLGTARSLVYTNGIGTSLIAGYGTTAKGWDGGQKISGRPGYAWYFGRDALWSGMAMLDYGDYSSVNLILNQFLKYQDLNGKIYHELTTSGAVHYDAADATPLFILLCGKYLRQSGNSAWLKENWGQIKHAIDYCFSTDTDGDHLIENTNVGHGWIEGGKLYGAHTTFYLASCWAGALRESFIMASYLKLDSLTKFYMDEAIKVARVINTDFWNEETGFYNYGKLKDGTYVKEVTVLPATFLLQKLAEPDKVDKVLRHYAGNGFSSDWGMRILKESSPLYNPEGYHYGSVWPLFTGWTSLAEYAYYRPIQGYMHLMNNLLIHKNFAKGFVEEVMNGEKYEPSGFCPQQCWSETMVIQPAIEGMLGYQAIAEFNQVQLVPAFPADWDSVAVNNIKVGPERFSMIMKKSSGKYKFTFETESKTPISVRFAPRLFPGADIVSYQINGKPQKGIKVNTENGVIGASIFDLNNLTTVEIETTGGISVLPVVPEPKPGDVSTHFRIINDSFKDNYYEIEVEGLSGSSNELKIVNLRGKPLTIENATVINQTGNILNLSVNFDKSSSKYSSKSIKLSFSAQ